MTIRSAREVIEQIDSMADSDAELLHKPQFSLLDLEQIMREHQRLIEKHINLREFLFQQKLAIEDLTL